MFPDLVVTSLVKFRLKVILLDPWAVQTLRYYLTVMPDTSVHRLPSLSSPRPIKQAPSDFIQNTFKRPRLLVIWTLHSLWHEEEVGPCLIGGTLYNVNPHGHVFLSLLTITTLPPWTEHDVRVWLYMFSPVLQRSKVQEQLHLKLNLSPFLPNLPNSWCSLAGIFPFYMTIGDCIMKKTNQYRC